MSPWCVRKILHSALIRPLSTAWWWVSIPHGTGFWGALCYACTVVWSWMSWDWHFSHNKTAEWVVWCKFNLSQGTKPAGLWHLYYWRNLIHPLASVSLTSLTLKELRGHVERKWNCKRGLSLNQLCILPKSKRIYILNCRKMLNIDRRYYIPSKMNEGKWKPLPKASIKTAVCAISNLYTVKASWGKKELWKQIKQYQKLRNNLVIFN